MRGERDGEQHATEVSSCMNGRLCDSCLMPWLLDHQGTPGLVFLNQNLQPVHTECICKTFTDNIFHLFWLQYLHVAIATWFTCLWLCLGHSKQLVKVTERFVSWLNFEKVKGDLKHKTEISDQSHKLSLTSNRVV